MTDTFSDPASGGGDRLPLNDLEGALLLIEVHSLEQAVPTTYGPSDAIKADVAVLDGDHKAETFNETLIFPRVLRSALTPNIGKKVIGRLGKGVAKPGQSAPWVLAAGTDADKEVGRKYLAWRASQVDEFATVQAQPAPAAAAPNATNEPF